MTSSPATTLNCTQCGGELHPDEGQSFVTCPFCSATIYIDKARVVFHWSLAPTVDAQQAVSQLKRWMSGSQTVKDLDKKAQITGQTFQYFPLWYFKYVKDGREAQSLELAAPTSLTELRRLNLPAGDLQRYDSALEAQSEPPNVPLEAAMDWLKQKTGVDTAAEDALRETALVHVPIYLFKYTFQGRTFTAIVEGATGSVIANLFPAKAEAPYLLAGGITALVYLCLASLVLVGLLSGSGSMIWVLVGLGLALLAAPFLFGFAVWVASKI